MQAITTRFRAGVLALWLGLSGVLPAEAENVVPSPGDAVPAAVVNELSRQLMTVRPDLRVTSAVYSPVPGLLELRLGGGMILYATADGGYLLEGDLYRLDGGQLTSLTEQARATQRAARLAAVPREDLIIFSPDDGETVDAVYVFTDVDCVFCQKLHREVPRLNELGIEVRYLAFPRAGVGSEAYKKIVTAWCADNPQETLTRLKRGESLVYRTCDNPVAGQYQLGQKMGVNGTPALVLESGELIAGYVPAEKLAAMLAKRRNRAND